jgi:Tfp pilus assembly protein PilO
MNQLKDILSKIPAVALLAAYALYLGYDYYEFTHDASSPLIQKQSQVDDAKKQSLDMQDKIKKAKEFYANLETRRGELRALALQLNELKATLSESLDLGVFIGTVVKEADKVGLQVQGIKPSELKESEYYTEQSFDMGFHGFYVQLLVLLDHLAGLERIIRVDKFTIRSSSPATAQYVDLEGTLQLKTYRYKGTDADKLGTSDTPSSTGPSSAPATTAKPPIASTSTPTGIGTATGGGTAPAATNQAPPPSQTAPSNSVNTANPVMKQMTPPNPSHLTSPSNSAPGTTAATGGKS